MRPRVALTLRSVNKKTGPIPVSTTEAGTCPASCPLAAGGCYAKQGKLSLFWRKVDDGRAGLDWTEFLARVRALPAGQLWRHNQAGDLPGYSDLIDPQALAELVSANAGRKGFTYTHKPPHVQGNSDAIAAANAAGFTVNLSANDLRHADLLADLAIGPVVTILPGDQMTNVKTPAGRTVVICPAVTHEGVTCKSCGLCARANRPSIVGFPAHGTQHKKATAIANGDGS